MSTSLLTLQENIAKEIGYASGTCSAAGTTTTAARPARMSALENVLPSLSANNSLNRWAGYTKLPRQCVQTCAFHISPANSCDCICGQASVTVAFALSMGEIGLQEGGVSLGIQPCSVSIPVGSAPLGYHIGTVVRSCAEEQVRRIDTEALVAGVADEQTVGNGAKGADPSKSVGKSVVSSPGGKVPVAATTPAAVPQPTGVLLRNMGPEPLFCGLPSRQAATLRTTEPTPLADLIRPQVELSIADGTNGGDFARMELHGDLQSRYVTPRGVTSTAEAFACPDYSTTVRVGITA